jgi:dTDP-glucose 4,6-dehydratase
MTYASNKELLSEFQTYKNFTFTKSDINDLKFLYECDYIINTAAETHVGNSIVSSDEFVKTNIDGVHNLLNLINNYRTESNKKPILLHFSTDEVYGDIENGSHSEEDLLKPSNPYSATKAAADMLILAWNRTYDLPFIIIRPTNNYGVNQYVEKLIPKFLKYLNIGRKIELHNFGTPIRTWLHVSDTVESVIQIIESNVKNEIFNVSGGFEQSNIDTIKKILQVYYPNLDEKNNIENYVDFSYTRKGQDMRYSLDDSKIKKLGWTPIKKFDDEIDKIVEFYKNKFIW